MENCLDSRDQLICIQQYLESLIRPYEKKAKTPIKIHETASMGISLTTTSRRGNILKSELLKFDDDAEIELSYKSKFTDKEETFCLNLSTIRCQASSANKTVTVSNTDIREICVKITSSKDVLVKELNIFFAGFIEGFLKFDKKLEKIIDYVKYLDVLCCLCYNVQRFNYCKPTICESEKSFVEVEKIRHCLIEHLQSDELYVTNDFSLGIKENGILLYGTNAVGKTSLIKSLGICVILAQAGMYVPCGSFKYKPYEYIFTRILGNDNIFKGLSTFAVEMSELRTILKLSTKNSLILGDELCSGTESDSARSIFVAGLENLHHKEASFIFATHFHEITHYDEIKELERLIMCHMTVLYDKSDNKLIYDRKLKEGPGDNMYGLEVCKALDLPDDFLSRAHNIRMKYNPETQNILNMKTSHFNSKKVKGLCELCKKEVGTEVHHLQYQKEAGENGFINADSSFHKNHPANLLTVCEECHNEVHKTNIQYTIV